MKISALFILFICVKTPQDILWYGMYCVVGVVGGNIFNFIRLKKYISFIPFKQLYPLKHLKPALRIFVLNLIISLYVNLNSVMLGFIKDTESVGLFTAATRLSQMILGVTSALGTVMLPRLTNLLSNQQKEEFNRLAQKPQSLFCNLIAHHCRNNRSGSRTNHLILRQHISRSNNHLAANISYHCPDQLIGHSGYTNIISAGKRKYRYYLYSYWSCIKFYTQFVPGSYSFTRWRGHSHARG